MLKKFDSSKYEPILHVSICTGETVFGFKDKNTNHFQEICLVKNDKELKRILKKYGLTTIKKEY